MSNGYRHGNITFTCLVVENDWGFFFLQTCANRCWLCTVLETPRNTSLRSFASLAEFLGILAFHTQRKINQPRLGNYFSMFFMLNQVSELTIVYHPNMENWMPEFHPQKPRMKFRNLTDLTCCYREGTLSWSLRVFFTLKRKCWRKSANEVSRCFFRS